MRRLAIFSGAFAAAAALFVYALSDVRALWLAGAMLVLSVLCRALGWRRGSVAALGLAVGLLYCAGYQQLLLKPAQKADGTEQTITLRVSEMPCQTDYGASVCGTFRLPERSYEAVLYGGEGLLEARPGDTLRCTARIEMAVLRPEDGESLYRVSQGLFLWLYAVSEPELTRGTPRVTERIALWLGARIDRLYEGEAAGLVRALLTGQRSGLSYQTQNTLSVTGISHAVAVSGMHVSMLMMLVSLLCGGNPRLMAALGMPVVVLFALMTGASPSVCRAAVMELLLLAAPLVRRERDGATTLGAAALLLLLQNPWVIASVSFQLSFAAVAGLFLLSEPIQRRILSLQKKPGRLLRFVASGVSATLGATALTLPLTVFYFGVISIVSPLTNLLCLWAVTGIFLLGLLSCCLGSLGSVLAWVVTLLSRYVLGLCAHLAAFPYASAYPHNLPLMLWAIAAYALVLTMLLLRKKLPVLWLLSGLTAGFLGCILWGRWEFSRHPWRFTALDVGQGQCLVLQLEDYTAVVDCGGSYSNGSGEELARYLHSAGVTHVDALILTHYDEDHSGGVSQLLNRVQVDEFFLPAASDETLAGLGLESRSVRFVQTLTEITTPGGTLTLYPPTSGKIGNNGGICVLARAAEYGILITGDLDQYGEMRLLSRWELPEVELLVAGHHGAEDSTSQVLLEALKPELVVISVAADNHYGHPAEETLTRIEQAGAEIIRTDQSGTIILTPEKRKNVNEE